ncbi:MAG: hypothetical protein ACYDCN_04680 [Bacteroidia bacterium]
MNKITLLKIGLLCSLFSVAQNIDTTKYQKVTPGDTVKNYYNQNNNSSGDSIKNYYPPDQNQQQGQPQDQQPKQYQPDKSYPTRNQRGGTTPSNIARKQPSSLESKLMEKLYFGCNLAAQYYADPYYGNVFYYDLSPNVGYKFTDKLSAGIQIVYNNSIQFGGGGPTVSYNIFGAGGFGRFLVFRSIFIQVEYDVLSVPQNYLGNAIVKRYISDEKLAGAGLKRNISDKLSYYIAVLYDFNPTINSPYYGNQLIYRIGITYNW